VPDLNITITVDGATAHVCGGMCDCPKAITRAQNAIDTDRAEHGTQPRGLSERLHGMRHGAPGPEWFDAMTEQAQTLEARAATAVLPDVIVRDAPASQVAAWAARSDALDAAMPAQRFAALDGAIMSTVMDLARAELLPPDHVSDADLDARQSLVFVGEHLFTAALHGEDAPAARYRVTTSTQDETGPRTERITADLNEVRAWLLAWCVAAMYH
jgi:hypothetical protein